MKETYLVIREGMTVKNKPLKDHLEAKDHFEAYVKTDKLFLLFVNSELVGFFNYAFQYSHYANYLEDICVADVFRGKGYSKNLLSKYIEIFSYVTKISKNVGYKIELL